MLKVSKDIEDIFLSQLKNVLANGKIRTSKKTKTTKKLIYSVNKDGDFVVSGKEITFQEETADFNDGVSDVVLRLIFESISTENAIKKLEALGYLVIDPTQTKSDSSLGLSDTTVNIIKSKILGIDNNE
jgi:hypothetical protein